jgi:uncharacterized protein
MVRVDATVCAPGVYTYYDASGKAVREYVPPEEIARADSIASLEDATVTHRHPRSMVDPSTWRDVSIGHARNGRADDGKAVATLVITRGDMQGELGKSLLEVSRGVNVRIDETPGVTPEGERYDRVQRDITYNHIALGPSGWGRQGSGVSLRLDAAGDELREDEAKEQTMKYTDKNGKVHEFKTDAELQDFVSKLDAAPPFPPKKKGEEEDEEDEGKKKAKKDALEAERARADAAERELQARKDADAKAARETLVTKARKVLGAEYKADSAAKDRDIHLAVLAKLQPAVKYDGRADAYVEASFDLAVEAPSTAGGRQDSLAASLYGIKQDGTRADEAPKPAERKDHRGDMIRKDSERSKKPLGQEYFGK